MQPQIERGEGRRRGNGGLHQISITYTLVGENGGGGGTVLCTTDPKKEESRKTKTKESETVGKLLFYWLGVIKTVKFASITLYVYAKRNVPGLKHGNENFRLGCPSGRVKYPSLSLFPSISLHARGGGGGGK